MAALKPKALKLKVWSLSKEQLYKQASNCRRLSPPDPVSLSLSYLVSLATHCMPCGILVPPTSWNLGPLHWKHSLSHWTTMDIPETISPFISAGNSALPWRGSSSSVDKTNTERGDCLTWTGNEKAFFPSLESVAQEPERKPFLLSRRLTSKACDLVDSHNL